VDFSSCHGMAIKIPFYHIFDTLLIFRTSLMSANYINDNRWVIMAGLIPWSEFEEEYASFFHKEMGAPAKSFRMANGALIIKEKLGWE